jgi:Domain of unknown function (DUF4184)
MPFTVAHVAAAVPLRRLNLVWSAFVVGSLAPDFPYVIGRVTYRSLGHDFPGVVLFTLPVSFVVLWFFHRVIKKPLAGLLPIGMQQRLKTNLESSGSAAAVECWQSRGPSFWALRRIWFGIPSPTPTPDPGSISSGCNPGSSSRF